MKRKNLAARVTAALFLLLLAYLTADNIGILMNTAKSYLSREISFADVLHRITEEYQEDLKQKEWIKITATVTREYWEDYQGEGPILHAISVEKTKAPKEEVISFS